MVIHSHDRLQSLCFLWFHNTHPELRYLMHANINSHPRFRIHDLTRLKSIGLLKGCLDLEFYYKGVLHVFDIKIGPDKLSPHQKEFIAVIEKQRGKGYEVRSLDEFKELIQKIIS